MIDPTEDARRLLRIKLRRKYEQVMQLTPEELELKRKQERRRRGKRVRRTKAQKPISRPKMGPKQRAAVDARRRASNRSELV